MTERKMIDEGAPVTTPEDGIQRKEAIMRRNFCVYVQKMHQDKNTPFVTEYQVLWTSAALIAVVLCVGGGGGKGGGYRRPHAQLHLYQIPIVLVHTYPVCLDVEEVIYACTHRTLSTLSTRYHTCRPPSPVCIPLRDQHTTVSFISNPLLHVQNITHTPEYVSATVYQSNAIKNRYINVFPCETCACKHSSIIMCKCKIEMETSPANMHLHM